MIVDVIIASMLLLLLILLAYFFRYIFFTALCFLTVLATFMAVPIQDLITVFSVIVLGVLVISYLESHSMERESSSAS